MADTDLSLALLRLLGPAGPELDCDQCFAELDRYVELELAGADVDVVVPGLRAHLAGCPAGAEEREPPRAARARSRIVTTAGETE